MSVICEVNCTQLEDPGVQRQGTLCTVDDKNVPCNTNATSMVREDICGITTTLEGIASANLDCISVQKKVQCQTEDIQLLCFEKQAIGAVPTKSSADTTTTSTMTSENVPSTTSTGPASTVFGSQGSSTAGSEASKGSPSGLQAKPTQDSRGISQGAIAGIGIGSALAGAAFAALIFLFLFTRYKKRHTEREEYSSHLPNYTSDAGRQEKEMQIPTKTGVVVSESYLPQPAEDDAIIGEFSKLRDNIKNHVQSFYITEAIDPQSLNRGVLSEVSRDAGIQFSKLQDLLANRTSRNSALRLCIGWMILSRCDGKGPADTSLLPDEAAAVAALLTDIDCKDSRKAILASKLKVISGALLQSRSGLPQPSQSANLEHRIEQALLSVNDFLTPFIESSIDATTDKRIRNLESIVRRASQLALLLFSQPSSWALDFGKSGTGQQGTIVVFPGLLEIVTEEGVVRQPPRQFRQPEVTATV